MSLWNRIRAGIFWTRAIGEIGSGNGAAATKLIGRMQSLISLKPYHLVMLAHAEILDGLDHQAEIHLRKALEMMSGNESANARYLKLHAQAILNLIEGEDYRELAREAAGIACTPRLKRWFPTREPPREQEAEAESG